LPNTDVIALAASDTNIFAGNKGVYYSNNNGTNWTNVSNGISDRYIISLAISGDDIFAGTYNGIYLTTNNGTNWTEVNNGLTNTTIVTSLIVSGNNILRH